MRPKSADEIRAIADEAALCWDLVETPEPGYIYDTIDPTGRFGQAWLPGRPYHKGQEALGPGAVWLQYHKNRERKRFREVSESAKNLALVRRFFPGKDPK